MTVSFLGGRTCWHRLCGVYVGFPFPEDRRSILPIKWRALHLNFEAHQGLPCPQTSLVLDNYAKSAHWLVDYNYKVGCLPEGLPELLQRPGGDHTGALDMLRATPGAKPCY